MHRNFEVNVNGQSLSRMSCYGYLATRVGETLNWQTQTDTKVTISANLGALKKVRDHVPRQTLIGMYEALLLPYFITSLPLCH